MSESAEKVIDPVCGMSVTPEAAPSYLYKTQTYYFCSQRCCDKFAADPEATLHPPETASDDAASSWYFCPMCPGMEQDHPGECAKCGMALEPMEPATSRKTQYTCPMHPEIVQDEPGDCPKCGMALEATSVTAEQDDPELKAMTRRFWVSLPLSIAVFLLAMSDMVPGLDVRGFLGGMFGWLLLVLATPVVFWSGGFAFKRAWKSVTNLSPNMWTLIALGVGAAYGFSLFSLLFPGVLPSAFKGEGGHVPLYFESAAVIVTLILIGQMLEVRARGQTSKALSALLDLTPPTANRLTDCGHEQQVALETLKTGDRLRVRPGEKVPVDGSIAEGNSTLDESLVTGEPIPQDKGEGDSVTGGTINQSGSFVMTADHVGDDTTLARIVSLVAAAQRSRAPIQGLADKVASVFVPAVVAVAVIAFVVWSLVGPEPAMTYGLIAAISVLIIACPCALGLATPMSVMVGVGRGARDGVLIRDAEALELTERVDTLLVDKTGTLTEGKPGLTGIELVGSIAEADLLYWVATLEHVSEHPLANAIVQGAAARDVQPGQVEHFESISGKGVSGIVSGHRVLVGNERLMTENGVDSASVTDTVKQREAQGETVMRIAVDGALAGLVAVTDPIKATTADAVQMLHQSGLRIVMLTGDSQATAQAVAQQLGIDECHAGALPEDKHALVEQLQGQGCNVAMAGDGVNDAPALARADVGIAMGTGTDIAMETAPITLVKGDLRGIAKAHRLSRQSMRNIRQNLFFAFFYNGVGVPIAAGVLYPLLGAMLSPMVAAAAMSLSSVSVISNALRLKRAAL